MQRANHCFWVMVSLIQPRERDAVSALVGIAPLRPGFPLLGETLRPLKLVYRPGGGINA